MSSEYYFEVHRKSYEFAQNFDNSFKEGNDSSTKLSPDNYESASENLLTDYEIVSNEEADSDEEVKEQQLIAQSAKLQNSNLKFPFTTNDKGKLHLSLSAEKIALKSQNSKKIDKSIAHVTQTQTQTETETGIASKYQQPQHQRRERTAGVATKIATTTYCQRHKRVHQQRQHVPISFTIVPISEMATQQQQLDAHATEDGRDLPAIVLTSYEQQKQQQQQKSLQTVPIAHATTASANSLIQNKSPQKLVKIPPPLAPPTFSTFTNRSATSAAMRKTKTTALISSSKATVAPEVNTNINTTNVNSNAARSTSGNEKFEILTIGSVRSTKYAADTSKLPELEDTSNSEINSQPGSSTSPESLMDNVLSAASSVSVRSSSLSSGGTEMTKITLVANNNTKQQQQQNNACSAAAASVVNVGANGRSDDGVDGIDGGGCVAISTAAVGSEPHVVANVYVKEINANRALNSKSLSGLGGLSLAPPPPTALTEPSTTQTRTPTPSQTLTSMLATMRALQPPELMEANTNRSRSPSPSQHSSSLGATPDPTLFPEELKCIICVAVYRDPRTLNCLHSFCFQCLVDENFKQDSSIAFWSEPSSQADGSEWKASNKSNYSIRSSSPEMSLRSGSTSPLRQRQASFSFKRKKSLERLLLKSKSDGKSSESSLSLRFNTAPEEKQRTICCKICNYTTEVPIGGIRQLPQNFVIMRKIDSIREKLGDDVISKIWCSLCFEETNATYHCSTCTLNLCTLCKESHERQRNTANHKIRNIMELRRARKQRKDLLRNNTNFKLKCGIHPGLEIKSFCISCLQIACADCLVLLHKGHKHEPIAKAYANYGKVLRDATDHARPLCNYTEHSIERLNEIAKRINKKCDDVQSEVETYMQQYFEAVEVHRKTMLQQVHRARESKVEMILEQQLDLERRKTESMHVVRFAQELLELGADVELLAFLNVLLKRFEYCQQFKTPINPKISDSLHFLPEIRAPSTKAQNDIPLYGIITMQTVEPALCTLQWEGFSQLRLHKRVELLLQSRDADGVVLCHGGLQIHALLKYKDSNSKFLPLEISDNRDGTYVIAFTPDSQGTLLLTVTINEKPIKGNPFTFLARTVRPHSGIYHCCAFCSSKGNKLVKCCCEGRMPGYNGCGHGHAGHPGSRHWSCCGNILENSECNVANKLLNS